MWVRVWLRTDSSSRSCNVKKQKKNQNKEKEKKECDFAANEKKDFLIEKWRMCDDIFFKWQQLVWPLSVSYLLSPL